MGKKETRIMYAVLFIIATPIAIWIFDDTKLGTTIAVGSWVLVVTMIEISNHAVDKANNEGRESIQEFVSERLGVPIEAVTIIKLTAYAALVEVDSIAYEVIQNHDDEYLIQTGKSIL